MVGNHSAHVRYIINSDLAAQEQQRSDKNIGASGFRVSRVARVGGHEFESTEMKEDGASEASSVAEAAGHGFDFLNAGVERFADGVSRGGDDGVDDTSEMSLNGGGEFFHGRELASFLPSEESMPSLLCPGARDE